MYGHALDCRTTLRPALPVPDRLPLTSVAVFLAGTGFGVATSDRPSGCFLVVNERRLPSAVPELLWATSR